jgi:hypothetical protein
MARGWESKAVEAQIDEKDSRPSRRRELSPEERHEARARAVLGLSRDRILHDLASCRAEAHRASLERALADVTLRLDRLARQR